MLNTRDLEERWLRYKIKSYIPHVIITISSLVIIAIISIFLNSGDKIEKTIVVNEKKVEQEIKQKIEPAPIKQKIVQVEKVIEEEPVKEKPIVLSKSTISSNDASLKLTPSLDFMKKMQHSSLPYYQEETQQQANLYNNSTNSAQVVEEVQDLDIEESVQASTMEEAPKTVTISRRNTKDDIRHIIKRFKKNNNPALSLFIAKKYYELGEYHKAYNYALITNEIDREIDASWIIFAKSLVKLNQKEMAIKTLKKYIENSHSSSAKILLEEIVSGKFK